MKAGAPGAPLVVSTRCPTCGAPLDFGEGSNAVRCDHCRSNLLVTGRRQVLSYVVDARVPAGEALSKARFVQPRDAASGAARFGRPRLCFAPYYRLSATELRWQWGEAEQSAAERLEEARRRSGMARAFDRMRERASDPDFVLPTRAAVRPGRVLRFVGRRIERNLLAWSGTSVASPSLGVRPSVLRLDLFRRDALPADAVVLPVTLPAGAALATAMTATEDEGLVAREVVSRRLSVVYFPLWVIPVERPGERRSTVLDAVTGDVVRTEGAPLGDVAGEADGSGPAGGPVPPDRYDAGPTLGFRPLVCPNCAWDLPVAPDDVVFHCSGCDRAWLLEGERMHPIPFSVAAAPRGAVAEYLPVWEIGAGGAIVAAPAPSGSAGAARAAATAGAAPGRFLVPAFRRRNLKVLQDIATRLTRKAPELAAHEGDPPSLRGCALDADDAAAVARFVARGVGPDGRPSFPGIDADGIAATGARLLWLPFLRDAYGLREPVTGTALPPELAAA